MPLSKSHTCATLYVNNKIYDQHNWLTPINWRNNILVTCKQFSRIEVGSHYTASLLNHVCIKSVITDFVFPLYQWCSYTDTHCCTFISALKPAQIVCTHMVQWCRLHFTETYNPPIWTFYIEEFWLFYYSSWLFC